MKVLLTLTTLLLLFAENAYFQKQVFISNYILLLLCSLCVLSYRITFVNYTVIPMLIFVLVLKIL